MENGGYIIYTFLNGICATTEVDAYGKQTQNNGPYFINGSTINLLDVIEGTWKITGDTLVISGDKNFSFSMKRQDAYAFNDTVLY